MTNSLVRVGIPATGELLDRTPVRAAHRGGHRGCPQARRSLL